MKTLNIGFYSNQLCVRGTEVAMYDYAHYNEILLGNKSIILYNEECVNNDIEAINKFKKRFNVIGLKNTSFDGSNELDPNKITSALTVEIQKNKIDSLYIIKHGRRDGILPLNCKTLIHVIGTPSFNEAHGSVFAYASDWLNDNFAEGKFPVVPYMIDMPNTDLDLRVELGIPNDALVFGRNGGSDTFDIPWVKKVIYDLLQRRKDVYFLFQNTDKFYDHPNIIHLSKTSDMIYKTKFVNTCDAMLHARFIGESFGLSCGEFSTRNKRVITWFGSPERTHISILGDRGIYYTNEKDLFEILNNYKKENPKLDLNCYRNYSPENVMKKFYKVFIEEKK